MTKKMINYGFIQTQKEKNQKDSIIKRGQHRHQKAHQDITGGILTKNKQKKFSKLKAKDLFLYLDFQANLPNEIIALKSKFFGIKY